MAGNSGYVDFTANQYGGEQTLRVHWQETVTDAPGSKSTVAITKVQLASNSYIGSTYYADFVIQINGTDAVDCREGVSGYGGQVYLSQFNTFTDVKRGDAQLTGSVGNISHTADGSKSINITLKKNPNTGYSYAGFWRTGAHFSFTTSSVNKSITLYTLPVSTLAISAATGSSITVKRNGTTLANGANLFYGQSLVITFGISTGYQLDSHTVNGSSFTSGGTYTVPDRNTATTITVATTASRSVSTISVSGTITFGGSKTITVTRYVNTYTHTIKVECAGQSYTICTKSSSLSITWNLAASGMLNMMNSITNAMSASATLTCTTYSGNTKIGDSSITVTINLPTSGTYNVTPTPAITDSDSTGAAQALGGYVAKKSVLAVEIDPGLKYSATLATRSTSANGVSSTAASFSAGLLTGDTTISTSIKDSRARTATASKNITVQAYNSPSITTFSVRRTDSGGTANPAGAYFTVSYAGAITSLGSHNTKKLKIQYKLTTASTWTTLLNLDPMSAYTVSGTTAVTAAAVDKSYDVKIELSDYFEIVARSTKLSTAAVVESRRPKGKGVAFGKVAEIDNAFDVGSWNAIGRVMGLGQARASISPGAAFSDYTEPGVYALTDNAASSISDCPSSDGGTLRVWNATGNSSGPGQTYQYLIQEYNDRYQNTWRRYGTSGSGTTVNWYAWSFYAGKLSQLKDQLGLGSLTYSSEASISNGGSRSFSISSSSRGVLVTCATDSSGSEIIIYVCNSSGIIYYATARGATGITITKSTNTLTIANSSGYAIYPMHFVR